MDIIRALAARLSDIPETTNFGAEVEDYGGKATFGVVMEKGFGRDETGGTGACECFC
jgi:hypothetical protein